MQTNTEQTLEGYIKRGDAHKTLEQFEEALRYYDRVINLAPDYSEAYYKRGDTYVFLGGFDEAIADFTHYLQFNPDSAMAYGKRGVIYMSLGRFDEALEDQKCAIERDPKFVDAYYNAGVILEHRKLFSEALTHFEKAAEFGDIESKTKASEIRQKLQNYPDVIGLNILQGVKSYSEMKRLVSKNHSLINEKVIENLREAIGQVSQSSTKNYLKRKFRWLQKAAREINT